ncbi:Endonuclease/Exonuclease/phosphatase family protein [Planctomycetes bacterium CA13]|uniref:Endonuclease/Exonuclease/phosphatase family protein n=1 Tax=Novipirellula herctigrandis TaxID=2527986 RepID=A0A5C5Z616_9BACT|nr:Endonuclease/Exonuclease/phosphatase family protein [Planctomycetes bacterium CA13]
MFHPIKIFLPICSAFLMASGIPFDPVSVAQDNLTVMTWNLEWFYDEESGDNYSKLAREKSAPDRKAWDWKRDAVAASLAKAKPTIVAVQEVENRRVLWYLTRSLEREHSLAYEELCIEGQDHFTEQDVGFLYRQPADLLLQTQFDRSEASVANDRYYNVTKHLMAVFHFPVGDRFERVTLMNVHLRSREEGTPIRIRQARLLHQWIGAAIERGENVILLGDLNTEERSGSKRTTSDVAIASGSETSTDADDLIDLNNFLPADKRQTHLVKGKQFDRILVSRSLVTDDPSKADLVFKGIKVLPSLNVKGAVDLPEQHWEHYWEIPPSQRDISDHLPVLATFEVK